MVIRITLHNKNVIHGMFIILKKPKCFAKVYVFYSFSFNRKDCVSNPRNQMGWKTAITLMTLSVFYD